MRYTPAEETSLLREAGAFDLLSLDQIDEVRKRYSQKDRYYHTWDHALDVLKAVLRLPLDPSARQSHVLAALFHDVCYLVGSKNNESDSAEFLDGTLGHHDALAYDLIMATATHGESTTANVDRAHRNFMDCDIIPIANPSWPLAIVNDWNVGAEIVLTYGVEASNRGRKDFLTKWLAKPSVFIGEFYGPTHEWHARQNLSRLIQYTGHDYSELDPAP